MLELIKEKIRNDFLIKAIKNAHCGVSFNKVIGDKLIFDFGEYYKQNPLNTRRCDFFIFLADPISRRNVCLLIELKGGSFKASTVSSQLRGGANLMNAFLRDVDVDFIPLVLTGKRIRSKFVNSRKSVVFSEVPYSIVLGRCGDTLNLYKAIYNR